MKIVDLNDVKKSVNIKIERRIWDKLWEMAKKQSRSVPNMAAHIIKTFIERGEKDG